MQQGGDRHRNSVGATAQATQTVSSIPAVTRTAALQLLDLGRYASKILGNEFALGCYRNLALHRPALLKPNVADLGHEIDLAEINAQ